MIEQVAWIKLSLLLKNILQTRKHYNYLQLISKHKLFTKPIRNAKLSGLARETQRSIKRGSKSQALKVRVAEFA